MQIVKVVYKKECSDSSWDGSNSRNYMGEDSWSVGETFNSDWIRGEVTNIYRRFDDEVILEVDGKRAMSIPYHAVLRLYYGE